MILLDRYDDLQTMLHHSYTYLSLIQDIFGIKNNTIQYAEDSNAPTKTTYPLDFDSDQILRENAFLDFNDAAPNVDIELNQWKVESSKFNATHETAEAMSMALTNAMDALPEISARKTKIDMHVHIATKILGEIKRRELSKLSDWEEDIMINLNSLNVQVRTDLLRYLVRETA